MATAKLTGTLNSGKTTFTVSKVADGTTVEYNGTASDMTVLMTATDVYSGINSGVTKIDISAIKEGLEINSPYLHNVVGGKGNDTITAIGKYANKPTESGYINIATGGGKDVINIASDTGSVTISDYTAGSDVIRLAGKNSANTADFSTSNISGSANASGSVSLNIGGAKIDLAKMKDKKITIIDESGALLMEQPFQRSDDLTLTNANSGTVVSSQGNEVVNASAKSKAFKLNVTTGTNIVTLGKANDTVTGNLAGVDITTGKGNDYIVISTETTGYFSITDFTRGEVGKNGDRLVLGTGIETVGSTIDDEGGSITFTDTVNHKSFIVSLGTGAIWNQINPTDDKKAQVLIVDSDGKESGFTLMDNNKYVPAKITEKAKTTIQFDSGDYAVTAANLGTVADYKVTKAPTATGKQSISFEATSLGLDITAPTVASDTARVDSQGGYVVKAMSNIEGGTGKDTLAGSAGTSGVAVDLNGGKGNDLLIGNVKGAEMDGGIGNDTLRGGAKDATVRAAVAVAGGTFGDASMTGGAGNDVFVLTGEGSGSIIDYTNATGKGAGDKAVKKAYGTDKIVIANDKVNAKGANAQSYLTGGSVDEEGNLVLTVSGMGYIDSVSAAAYVAAKTAAGVYGEMGGYDSDTKFMTTTTATGAASVAGSFAKEFTGGTYTINQQTYYYESESKDYESVENKITVVDQGITYTQDVLALDYAKDSDVSVTANYHTALNPFALKLDGAATKKAMRIVAVGAPKKLTYNKTDNEYSAEVINSDVTIAGGTKNDTLIAGANASLNGGTGNDIFWVKNGKTVTIADFGGAQAKEGDKVYLDSFDQLNSLEYTNSSKDVKLGNITIANGVGFTTKGGIGFYVDSYTDVVKKNQITGTKKTTDAMIRTFGTNASIAAAGAGSTFFKTFSGDVDSSVMVVDVSKGKGVNLEIGSTHVVSIKGGAKADTIKGGSTFDSTVFSTSGGTKGFSDTSFAGATIATVTTGKGNDVIYNSSIVVADFQAAKATAKNGAVTKITGDALYFTCASASDVSVASAKLSDNYDDEGHKKQGNDNILVTFDGQDVTVGNVKLAKMKGKQAYIYTGKAADGTTDMGMSELAASNMATLNNLHEFVASNATYGKGKAVITGALGTNATANVYESDVYIIDATAVSGAKIDMGKTVTEVYAGKGVDTIYAGQSLNLKKGNTVDAQKINSSIAAGAGADFIVFDADSITSGATYYLTDYAADKVHFNGLSIASASIGTLEGIGDAATISAGKGSNAKTYYTSDVTLTLSNDAKVVLVDQTELTGFKLTQVDSVTAKGNAFALTYGASDVTVGAADGATINLTGAGLGGTDNGKLSVDVDSKRSKAVTFDGVDGINGTTLTITMGSSKAGGTFIGGTDINKVVTFTGGAKADAYYGGKAADTIDLGAGNDTIFGGGKATIKLGSGNDVAIVNAGDAYTISDMAATNKVLLNTVDDTLNRIVSAKVDANKNLILGFGNGLEGDKASEATVTFTSGAGVAINVAQLGTNAKKAYTAGTAISNLTYYFSGTADAAGSNVNSIVGGNGNDTITTYTTASALTGGKGNDTFVLNLSKGTTITDFNTGKDVLDLTGSNAFKTVKWADYGAGYKFDASTKQVELYSGGETITLKNTEKEADLFKNGVTTNIRYKAGDDQSSAGIKLSDNVNITLAASAEIKADDYMGYAKTFDGSKSSKTVTNTGFTNTELTSYKGSKGADTVTFESTAKVAVAFTGGTDVYTNAGANSTFSLSNSGWVVSGATVETGTGKLTATLTIKNGTKASAAEVGKITIDDSAIRGGTAFNAGTTELGALTFTLGTSTVAGEAKGGATGVSGWAGDVKDSDTYNTVISYQTYNVAVNGISGTFQYGSSVIGTAAGSKKSYEERFEDEYSLIVTPETLFGSSEFDAITTPDTTSIDISSLDFSTEAVGGFKAGDVTFDTSLVGKKTQQDK